MAPLSWRCWSADKTSPSLGGGGAGWSGETAGAGGVVADGGVAGRAGRRAGAGGTAGAGAGGTAGAGAGGAAVVGAAGAVGAGAAGKAGAVSGGGDEGGGSVTAGWAGIDGKGITTCLL